MRKATKKVEPVELKTEYAIGDSAWVYGVVSGPGFNKPTKGKVVHSFEIDGFYGVHYVIAIPTSIETLLEIRNWESISQDAKGPIGGFRSQGINKFSPERRVLARTGLVLPQDDVDEQNQESDKD